MSTFKTKTIPPCPKAQAKIFPNESRPLGRDSASAGPKPRPNGELMSARSKIGSKAAGSRAASRSARLKPSLIRQTARLDAEARQFYPQLFDPAALEFQQRLLVMRELPWLRLLPNALLILGDALAGQQARFARRMEGRAA